MNPMIETAQAFFNNTYIPTSGELLTEMDLFTMMMLIKIGKNLRQDKQEDAIELRLLGKTQEADKMANDVSVMNKNLSALDGAYRFAMN